MGDMRDLADYPARVTIDNVSLASYTANGQIIQYVEVRFAVAQPEGQVVYLVERVRGRFSHDTLGGLLQTAAGRMAQRLRTLADALDSPT